MHVFLDLDGTLVRKDTKWGKYHADGDVYAPLHGCNEFLLALGSIPGIQVSFFSYGTESRNKNLVSELINDTLSLLVDGEETPAGLKEYTVFSQEHADSSSMTCCKRLEPLTVQGMDQTIMVDDMANLVCAEGEEKNFIPVYNEVKSDGPGVRYTSAVFSMRKDNNLVRVLGMILWCLKMSNLHNISVVQALVNLQWRSFSYRHRETNSKKIYCLGVEAMSRFTPDFELLDREQGGFLPWLPRLAELNPQYRAGVFLWNLKFGFETKQVQQISSSICNLPMEDLQGCKFDTVTVIIGAGPVHLPETLSEEATQSVVADITECTLPIFDRMGLESSVRMISAIYDFEW